MMHAPQLINPKDAEIVVFNKGGRYTRQEKLQREEEAPREFFYGFLELQLAGFRAVMLSSAGRVPGLSGKIVDAIERAYISVTRFGVRPFSARLRASTFGNAKVVISYTDGFSLSLGIGCPPSAGRPVMIGGFHGLSDIETRVAKWSRSLTRMLIQRALKNLDHVFFFGSADREFAVDNYGLAPERSSVIPFGVDTEFWRPMPEVQIEDFALAVGQDLNRDYDLLVEAPGKHRIVIITRQPVHAPPDATHVTVTAGDYFGADSMSDQDLRRLYNCACAVVVPLKDVYQPSGYSVTLQAMSCARPVILSNIRGLWAPELLKDGENCLLVPPGDAAALGAAIGRLRVDRELSKRLGQAARATALAHFGLNKIAVGTMALAQLGLSMYDARKKFTG